MEEIQSGVDFFRGKRYLTFIVGLMALVAIMDQYLSFIETTAIADITSEYGVTASEFSWWETLYFIPTFFIFLLNGLNDMIGRRYSILILILMMGCSSLAVVLFTPSFHLFMICLSIITFTTVSNMWTIPVSEESPAGKRAKMVSIVYAVSLLPFAAVFPILVTRLGLSWKWMYGIMFLFMIPVLILWLFMKEPKRYETIIEERKTGLRKKHFFGFGVITKADMNYILFSAGIWLCWLVISLIGGKWIGYYFREIHGYSVEAWSLVFLGVLLMMLVGSLAGGWTMDKIGRKKGLLIGCSGLGFFMGMLGFLPVNLAQFFAMVTGFFMGFSYTWIIVYIPEIFPTDRRGVCMGWTTTIARVSYVVGPAFAAVLLTVFPAMDYFWICAGLIMIIPVVLVVVFHPYETNTKELEQIEQERILA